MLSCRVEFNLAVYDTKAAGPMHCNNAEPVVPATGQNETPTIQYCDDAWATRWDAFLANQPSASFYHLYGWRRIVAENFSHPTKYLAVRSGDEIAGVLPLVFLKSRLFGKILCSMPFVNYGAPCATSADADRSLREETKTLARTLGVDYVEMRSLTPAGVDWQANTHKVSMTITLDHDPDKLWSAYDTKHRTNIRRAYKHGFEVRSGGAELLDDFFTVVAESWRNLGTPLYRKSYFASILATFPERTRIFVTYAGKEPVAVAFNGYYRGTVEGMWAGTRAAFRAQQPNYVLYWEMIKHACETGCHTYHLGRSTADSAAETFKRKWNAEARPLYWQYYLPRGGALPALNVNNPKYQLAISLWRRLPIGVTTLLGPYLANYIP